LTDSSFVSAAAAWMTADCGSQLSSAKEARCLRGETGTEARRRGVVKPVDPLKLTSVGLKM
jgi:hypothetical protein